MMSQRGKNGSVKYSKTMTEQRLRSPRQKIVIQKLVSSDPLQAAEQGAADSILARLIALAYASDHPSQFPRPGEDGHQTAESEPTDSLGSRITE